MLWIALVVCLTATTTMVASLDHYQSLADLVAAASRGHARKEPPTHHAASNVIFCDMRQMTTQASNTSSNSKLCAPGKLEFSFSVFLNHPGGKKESMSELSSLRRLAKTLSESSRCDVHHLKYEERAQRLAESRAGDQTSFWHEDKKTKSTSRPQVSVIRDESKHNGSQRKSLVVFECSLPASDVWLSVNGSPRPPKSAHTHPHAAGQVTVSAMRVTLSFAKSLDDTLSVNVRNKQLTHDHAVDGYHPSNSSSSSSSFFTNRKSTERYLVYYDGKCKKCGVAVQTRVIDPFQAQSLKCATKETACEYKGKCFEHKEIYTAIGKGNSGDLEQDQPSDNATNVLVCNSAISRTSLYMPCAIDNGGCKPDETCLFDARTLAVSCT